MISFACSACGKQLKVKDELLGKKVKCPGCAKAISAPNKIEALPSGASPPPGPKMPTLAPTAPKGPAEQVTVPPPGLPEVTRSHDPADLEHESSLTDFLSPPQADDELGRLGGFRILKVLGHGGMGVVFQGEDPKLGRKVAIKAMLPHLAQSRSAQERFLREARAAAALEHDHIVAIHHVGEDRGAPFIVMPLLKGEPLDERLRRDETLSIPEVLRIGREIAEGLAAAHAAGLIHRDVKPANIWLEEPHQRVKILDFGLARATAGEAGLTRQGAIVGTPAFMAPEQGRGETVDTRCDLFSLGCVLYRMGTGRMPFQGKDMISILVAVERDNPPPPVDLRPELPGALSELVVQLLAKKREDRLPTAQVVAQALGEIERETTEVRASPGTRSRQGKERVLTQREAARTQPELSAKRSRLSWLVGAGVVGLGVLTAAIVLFWPTPQGTVRIESDDPNVEIVFDKAGPTIKGADREPITLRAGEHGVLVKRGDFAFEADKFVLGKGQAITLKVEWLPGKVQIVRDGKVVASRDLPRPPRPPDKEASVPPVQPAEDAWLQSVAAMRPAKQVEAVASKLKDLNPAFDGKVTPTFEDGVVTRLELLTDHVTDIWPVRALTGLTALKCNGSYGGKGKLADLSPLKGMPLTYLDCGETLVSDLSPMKGMPLTYLNILRLNVSDLSPLKGMPLTYLYMWRTPVSDLTPLEGMPLKELHCGYTRVADFSPLKKTPIKLIGCGAMAEWHSESLRSLKTLESINGKSPAEFFKELDAKQPPKKP